MKMFDGFLFSAVLRCSVHTLDFNVQTEKMKSGTTSCGFLLFSVLRAHQHLTIACFSLYFPSFLPSFLSDLKAAELHEEQSFV